VGPAVCEAIRPYAQGHLIDVHLMTDPVDELIPAFAKAGAASISFHPEATRHVSRTIRLIKEQGCRAGMVFNPGTPLDWLDDSLEDIDMVLLMSVNPGFGGQSFIPSTLNKLRRVRQRIEVCQKDTGRRALLQVDGGVKADNIAAIAAAGADVFVAGSAIFGTKDYRQVIAHMKQVANAKAA
jgi:ribulose-phosphate 3-epimerase